MIAWFESVLLGRQVRDGNARVAGQVAEIIAREEEVVVVWKRDYCYYYAPAGCLYY